MYWRKLVQCGGMRKKPQNRYHRGNPKQRKYKFQVDRDTNLDILEAVARLKNARTSAIARAVGRKVGPVTRRLRDLFDLGLIDRTDIEHRDTTKENFHIINEKGLEKLAENDRHPNRLIKRQKGEQRMVKPHELLVTSLLAGILSGAKDRLTVHPTKRVKLPYKIKYTFAWGEDEEEATIRPDAVLSISHGVIQDHYVVECENTSPVEPVEGGLSRSGFLRKALAYGHILFDAKIQKEKIGFHKLRVLVTALTLAKMHHKMAVCKRLFGENDTFLFQVVSHTGEVQDLFNTPWYTTRGMFSLDTGKLIEEAVVE